MTDRRFDRIADAYLAAGPVVLPDRVLDAAFEEVHRTRQRRVLWRAPWRFSSMNTFAKAAVAAVAVIAVGLVGLTFLQPGGNGGVGAPSAAPSPTVAPTPTPTPAPTPTPDPTAAPLTGQFTSDVYGISLAYPEGWVVAPATAPCVTAGVNYIEPGADIIHHPEQEANLFMRICSQALGDRTADEWGAEMLATDECGDAVSPITIGGHAGVITTGCDHAQVVVDGRGYVIRSYTSGDEPWIGGEHDRAWFESVLATVELHPEDAVDEIASPSPS